MYFRPALVALSFALLIAFGTGCQKSTPAKLTAAPTVLSPDTVASVHWYGKKRIGITFGAYYFSRVWQQPQSAQLERQTLVKLASTPGQWLPGGTNLNADACSRLWWMLNDILQEESYLEIRQTKSGNADTVFAIQLNGPQSDQWRTNLPVVLELLTGVRTTAGADPSDWSLPTTGPLGQIGLTRAGQWTLVSAGPSGSELRAEITARIRRDGVPFVSGGTNLWLEADLQPARLSKSFSLSAPGGEGRGEVANPSSNFLPLFSCSRFNLSLSGDGANVITRARLTLPAPLSGTLDSWQLPVDLIHSPLTSLTAVRGFSSWVTNLPVWRDLNPGFAPDQFSLWSLGGNPYTVYLASPQSAATVSNLADRLMQAGNPWLAARGYISFERSPDGNGVTWGNLPDIKPFIRSAETSNGNWLLAGLFPETNSIAQPPPAGLIQDILRRTNVVYYDWEVTGPRLQPALQVAQTVRLVTRQSQLPVGSAGLQWLAAAAPRLGTSATIVSRISPVDLTLYRRSTLGLTSVELQLLTGWLESPAFPK